MKQETLKELEWVLPEKLEAKLIEHLAKEEMLFKYLLEQKRKITYFSKFTKSNCFGF